MNIEYELKKEDYKISLFELLIKELYKSAIYILCLSLIISLVLTNKPFQWKLFLIYFITSFFIIFFFVFGRIFYKIHKTLKLVDNNPLLIGKKNILLNEEGIIIGIESIKKYEWISINRFENLSNYILIIFHDNTSITIKKKGIKNEDLNKFIGKLKSKLISVNETPSSKSKYWIGIFGFIPNFGIIIGSVLTYKGFKRSDNKLKLIGISNILFTPLFWFMFTHYTNKSSIFKDSNIEFTNHFLNEVVKDVEYFKVKNGHYPDSLGELRKENKFFNDNEIFVVDNIFKEEKQSKFFYLKSKDSYILKSFGPDRILNTNDDIYPKIKIEQKIHTADN